MVIAFSQIIAGIFRSPYNNVAEGSGEGMNRNMSRLCSLHTRTWLDKDWPVGQTSGDQGNDEPSTRRLEYPLRILVLTYRRAKSLERLFNSLTNGDYFGDSVALDILIDRYAFILYYLFEGVVADVMHLHVNRYFFRSRPADGSPLDEDTVHIVSNLRWPHGPCRALLRQEHAGLRGQWLGCWSPRAVIKTPLSACLRRAHRELPQICTDAPPSPPPRAPARSPLTPLVPPGLAGDRARP
jgi:hypothetical protein